MGPGHRPPAPGRPLAGVDQCPSGVALSADGRLVALDQGPAVGVWDAATGRRVGGVAVPAGARFVRFSPDAALLVGDDDGTLAVADWRAGNLRVLLRQPNLANPSTMYGLYAPVGRLIVAGGLAGGGLRAFDPDTGRPVYHLPAGGEAAAVSPDGRTLAVAGELPVEDDEGRRAVLVRLHDLATGGPVGRFVVDGVGGSLGLGFAPGGRTLAVGGRAGGCLVAVPSGRELWRLAGGAADPAFTPDGRTLVAAAEPRLRVWDAATGRERAAGPAVGDGGAVAVSPDGRRVATHDWDADAFRLWDAAIGRHLRRLPLAGRKGFTAGLWFAAGGRELAAGWAEGRVERWDAETGERLGESRLSRVLAEMWPSPDGRRVAALTDPDGGGGMRRLAAWGAAGRRVLARPLRSAGHALAWTPDGRAVAFAGERAAGGPWADDGRVRRPLPGADPNGRPRPSDDGRLVVAPLAGEADRLGVWETASLRPVARLPVDGRWCGAVLRGPGLAVLVSDADLLVWGLAAGRERCRWRLPGDFTGGYGVCAVAGSPDGRWVLAVLSDGTALVWPVPADTAVRAGPADVSRWLEELGSADAGRAFVAARRLADGPAAGVVPALRMQLRPDARGIGLWESAARWVLESAADRLDGLADEVAPAVSRRVGEEAAASVRDGLPAARDRLAGPPLSDDAARRVRAVGVLEQLGTADARRLLGEVAGGPPSPEGRAARAALVRLAGRPVDR